MKYRREEIRKPRTGGMGTLCDDDDKGEVYIRKLGMRKDMLE